MQRLVRDHLVRVLAGWALALSCATAAHAGFADGAAPGDDPNPIVVPDADKAVKVTEHLGARLPLDATFTDDEGKTVQLKQYFSEGKKPVVLQIGYFRCPMLCGVISQKLVDALKDVKLNAGPDYEVVFLSIDPRETPQLAADKKTSFLEAYAHDGSSKGWHLLTGSKDQIDRVTGVCGFEYKWVAQAQQYSHPGVVILATPDGKLSRYLYFGQKIDGQTMRLSLVEASNNQIGTTTDQFMLTCFQYDGKQGKYALAAIFLMKIGGLVTVLLVGGVLLRMHQLHNRRGVAHRRLDEEPLSTEKQLGD